jgi:proton-dependent oligopeptide transporter, POT family
MGKFPRTFWVACGMEVFERMAWYGFFAVSSLYITGTVASGGLGLSDEQRGVLQGIIPFLLYLFPVVTGALADKFGYKKTFFAAFLILTPAYYLLGVPDGFWGFFFVFLLVALGAATFKPVVVGTVSHTTTDETKSMGFGVFYMVVNIGGFAGPIVASYVRETWDWSWVFKMSAIWMGCNFLWLFLFYKEPEGRTSAAINELKKIKDKMGGKQGSAIGAQLLAVAIRLGPTFIVAGILLNWLVVGYAIAGFAALAIFVGILITVVPAEVRVPLRQTGRDIVEVLGNSAFFTIVMGTIFLLMLFGGDWISLKQLGILAPVLILGNLAFDQILRGKGTEKASGLWAPAAIGDWRFVLYLLLLSGFWTEFNQIFITMPLYIRDYTNTHDILQSLSSLTGTMGWEGWQAGLQGYMNAGKQIKPELLINVDAGAIILLQILISAVIDKWKPFNTMIVGTIITGAAMAMGMRGETGWMVVAAIFIFAIGEMMASPKSQEYVARIAPPDKTAMYMGYYFVSIALGNLFGGILSGKMYGHFGRDKKKPATMWGIFGAIGLLTAGLLWLYDRFVGQKTPAPAEE